MMGNIFPDEKLVNSSPSELLDKMYFLIITLFQAPIAPVKKFEAASKLTP